MSKKNFLDFYKKNGYIILKVFNKNDIESLKFKIKKKATKHLKKKNWKLENYHKHVNQSVNSKIAKNKNRFINVENSIIKKLKSNKKIKKVLDYSWSHSNFTLPDQKYLIGRSKSTTHKKLRKREIQFRIVVPQKKNILSAAPPPHVDLNAGKITNKILNGKKVMDTSSLQFTLWTPLIGFTKNYTLRVAPGSHLNNHPINRISKNNKYYKSPVFDKKYYKKFKFKRFNLSKGQCILFDGNLIHGGTNNHGNKTRVNLEFRLYNDKSIKILG